MALADLHVHSKYSKHPSEWFLQRIGTRESYTELESLYNTAKKRGMRFVTLTDHNTIEGSLKLNQMYPDDTFIGVEVTTYFPENGCKIHILVYGLDEKQFSYIDRIRCDIYQLRDFLKKERLVHSVAHATFGINRMLSLDILERLILLFDVFEGINGSRNSHYNQIWMDVLKNLTPEKIDALYKKYRIKPFSDTPWIKGLTAGSDDHSGLFIGKTFTSAQADTPEQFMQTIYAKNTFVDGKSSNYKVMAFTLYKIVHDFCKNKTMNNSDGLWYLMNEVLFENKKFGFKNRFYLNRMKKKTDEKDRIFVRFFDDLVNDCANSDDNNEMIEEKLNKLYYNIAELLDDFLKMILFSLEKGFSNGDIQKLTKNFSAALPALFLTAPFLSTLKHMWLDKDLVIALKEKFTPKENNKEKKILWFSDTVNQLNGVSSMLHKLKEVSYRHTLPLKFVVCNPDIDPHNSFLSNSLNLTSVYEYTPDFYSNYTLYIPSILKSLEIISNEAPDEIIISTPGPVGLLGLLYAKLANVSCKGIYHTDFGLQIKYLIKDDGMLATLFENSIKWFYSSMDQICIPSSPYMNILEDRGYNRTKMKMFKRGIDTDIFHYKQNATAFLKNTYSISQTEFNLIYTGRISADKNLNFLSEIYQELSKQHKKINLTIIGDGPYLTDLKKSLHGYEHVHFTGKISRQDLPYFYSASDLFVFPSVTDTFGMVVLESLACGCPPLVTNTGGPQEVVNNINADFVLPANDQKIWAEKIVSMLELKKRYPAQYNDIRKASENYIKTHFAWENTLNDILETDLKRQPIFNDSTTYEFQLA